MYLLYGIGSSRSYKSFHLLLRDTNTATFIQNVTMIESFGCSVDCEMKAT